MENRRLQDQKGDLIVVLNLNVKYVASKARVAHTYKVSSRGIGPTPVSVTSRGGLSTLYVELQEIRKNLVDDLREMYHSEHDFGGEGKCETWEEMKTYPEFFSVPLRLRDDIEALISKAEKVNNSLDEIQRIIDPIIIAAGRSVLETEYDNVQQFFIYYTSKTGSPLYNQTMPYYIVLGIDPLEDLEQRFPDFTPQRSHLFMTVGAREVDLPLVQIQDKLNRILEITKQKMRQEKEIVRFLEERNELSDRIDKLLLVIGRYIEKHYPIEKL